MAERTKNMREKLLLAGIHEIEQHGCAGFSVRRVAQRCGVSCAAPYKHFRDKRDFIASIIEFVNEIWAARQQEVLDRCSSDLREQIVEVCVHYVKFLMENPYFRSILMLKDEEFDNIYHKMRGQMSSRSQTLAADFLTASGMDPAIFQRKRHTIRALLFGTVFLYDTGELTYNDATVADLRRAIDREFDLP